MPTLDWTTGALAEGLHCYRGGQFFEAHEHWEQVWLQSTEPEKTFLQALIQMAGAFHHLRRGNRAGTQSLLKGALRRLGGYPETFSSIDVAQLRAGIERCIEELQTGREILLKAVEIQFAAD